VGVACVGGDVGVIAVVVVVVVVVAAGGGVVVVAVVDSIVAVAMPIFSPINESLHMGHSSAVLVIVAVGRESTIERRAAIP
jgi:hypothetical protein